MKYIWEEDDIVPGRRVWGRCDTSNLERVIGYSSLSQSANDTDTRFCVFALCDGGVQTVAKTAKELANWLNESGYRPVEIIEPYMRHRSVPLDSTKGLG